MLLHDVAITSMDVAATSSRLTKVARIAALLHRAAPDTQLVTIIVSWLSGELPQRHIGVGWAALRSLPPPAPQPALTVTGVDATLSKIGTLSGKGSQAQRAALVAELFSAATEAEQTFLLRLLGGELRQGAKGGIMADAVAQAAGLPAATVQRAAMLGGDLAAAAAAGLSGAALDTFTLRVGRPIGPMLAQTATSVHDALERHGGTTIFEAKLDGARVQIHRANDQVRIYTRSLDDVTARLPEVVEATLALPVRDLVADGEAIALCPDNRPQRFQVTASRFGRSVDVAAARATQPLSVFFFDILHRDGTDLLEAPTTERLAALDALVPARHRVDRLIVRSNGRGQLPGCDAGRRPEGDGQGTGRSLPCGSPRSGLAEGQAGAHTRLGGARGGMGLGTPARQALQYSPGRTRSGYRWIRDGGQDLQRNDRRHAGLADHQVSRDRGGSDRRLRRPT